MSIDNQKSVGSASALGAQSAGTAASQTVGGIGQVGPCYHTIGVTCNNCRPVHTSPSCPYCNPRCAHGYPVYPGGLAPYFQPYAYYPFQWNGTFGGGRQQ